MAPADLLPLPPSRGAAVCSCCSSWALAACRQWQGQQRVSHLFSKVEPSLQSLALHKQGVLILMPGAQSSLLPTTYKTPP